MRHCCNDRGPTIKTLSVRFARFDGGTPLSNDDAREGGFDSFHPFEIYRVTA